jgi:signal transduction histidine kinase
MNIKTRLALNFSLLVLGILLFFMVLTYYFSYTNQLSKFRENMLIQAQNDATLLINVVEVDSSLLKKIHQSTLSWEDEEIAITDTSFKIIWSNNIQYLTNSVITSNTGNDKSSFFKIKEKEGIHYIHEYNNKTYHVYVLAFDSNRADNLSELRKIFFWSLLFSLWLSVLLSYLFSKIAIRPISQIINKIETTNSAKLSNRINVGNRKDEIGQLATKFNEMMENIEIAFKNQKEFASNASHELRTPLAVMTAESEYLLSKERTQKEYTNHIAGIIHDLRKLNSLLNNLLELAQLNRDNAIQLSHVHIDEIIYTAVHQVKTKHHGRKILTKILYSENENDLLVNGNAGLLEIAFKNLLDNACKFSTDEILVEILIMDRVINIIISDKGIGIPENEIDSIFKPFSRAGNVRLKAGFGIGLYLVFTIIKIHSAEIKVNSTEHKGTRFELLFNKIEN